MLDHQVCRIHSWLRAGTGILLFLSFLSIALQAQVANTGSVQGTVSDTTGTVIPGATVTLHNVHTGNLSGQTLVVRESTRSRI